MIVFVSSVDGWDFYDINEESIRELTDKEEKYQLEEIARHNSRKQVLLDEQGNEWLDLLFVEDLCVLYPNHCAKIVEHIEGGE